MVAAGSSSRILDTSSKGTPISEKDRPSQLFAKKTYSKLEKSHFKVNPFVFNWVFQHGPCQHGTAEHQHWDRFHTCLLLSFAAAFAWAALAGLVPFLSCSMSFSKQRVWTVPKNSLDWPITWLFELLSPKKSVELLCHPWFCCRGTWDPTSFRPSHGAPRPETAEPSRVPRASRFRGLRSLVVLQGWGIPDL